jgi:hypothetical protein
VVLKNGSRPCDFSVDDERADELLPSCGLAASLPGPI